MCWRNLCAWQVRDFADEGSVAFLKNPLLINPLYFLAHFGSASRSKLLA